jgi:hypothetical protein
MTNAGSAKDGIYYIRTQFPHPLKIGPGAYWTDRTVILITMPQILYTGLIEGYGNPIGE